MQKCTILHGMDSQIVFHTSILSFQGREYLNVVLSLVSQAFIQSPYDCSHGCVSGLYHKEKLISYSLFYHQTVTRKFIFSVVCLLTSNDTKCIIHLESCLLLQYTAMN